MKADNQAFLNGQFSCRLLLGTIQRKPENVNEPKDHSVLLKC